MTCSWRCLGLQGKTATADKHLNGVLGTEGTWSIPTASYASDRHVSDALQSGVRSGREGDVVTTESDGTDDEIADDTDGAIVRAIGEELRRARANAGWSRPQLIKYMKTQIPVNTYACYEQGIRQCSIPRLVEICQALGVSAAELIGLALQRLELDLNRSVVQIDLRKIVRDDRRELRPLRRWARNRIKEDAIAVELHEPAVVHLQWSAVKEIATFCGISKAFLLGYIRDFSPESTVRAARTVDSGA